MNKILYKALFYSFAAILCLVFTASNSNDKERNLGNPDKYISLKIFNNGDLMKSLQKLEIDIDHFTFEKDGSYIKTILDGAEVKLIKDAGIHYEIIYGDWHEDYYNRLQPISPSEESAQKQLMLETDNVAGFGLGSMGGYYTHDEAVQKIDSMRMLYPTLISAKFQIGTTILGRPMWAYKITKNPEAANTRPKVLYTALIHAREPISMMNLIYYSFWLLENYNTDETAKYLVDNREMYFIPIINPDGYIHNQTTNPNGGGMWRKNRRNNGSSFGIDLNRNFGTYQFWNSPNGGSSTSPSSDTYRGPTPFSEPETQALMNFVNTRNFVNSLFYHAYGNLMIYPWAWIDPQQTPDSTIFNSWSGEMVSYNGYLPGPASVTVGYQVRGGSDDWLYNDSGHTKVIGMTPEIGNDNDGFWPQQNRIFPLVMENLKSNVFYAGVADTFAQYKGYNMLSTTLNFNDTLKFGANIKSVGIKNASNVNATVIPLDTALTILQNNKSFGSFTFFQTKNNNTDPFRFKIKNVPNGYKTKLLIQVKLGSQIITKDTIKITLGTPTYVLNDPVTTTSLTNWTRTGSGANIWDTTSSTFVSPNLSYTDSRTGNYGNNITNILTLNSNVSLAGMTSPVLTFNTRYDLENGWDYGQVQISTNNGSTWTALQGSHTLPGSGTFQPNGQPVYNGTKTNWVQEEIDLSAYLNQSVRIRFYLRTDGVTVRDGWYVDDIKIAAYNPALSIGENEGLPSRFEISQNYPNPFNPVTNIKYALPRQSAVTIRIYDITGKLAAELVNDVKAAGYYSVSFDASSLSSGIYYYTIKAGDFIETKKMSLIK